MSRFRLLDHPPVVRRLYWWWLLPVAGIAACCAWTGIIGPLPIPASAPRWVHALAPSAVFVPQFVTMAVFYRRMRRIKRAYHTAEGCLCTSCLHDLRGLEDRGLCPECGKEFQIEPDREDWARCGVRLRARTPAAGSRG